MPLASEDSSAQAWNDALLADPHAVADKHRRVRRMFAAIAPSYDLNNRLHSLGLDRAWRRRTVELADVRAADTVVDVACGTGDLTLAFASRLGRLGASKPSGKVIGIDFTFEMLPLAVGKSRGLPIVWLNGDALAIPLPEASADVVSIAFGIRNVSDPAAAMREFSRILRPGGRLVILEFSLPTQPVLRSLYNMYFRHVLPHTATWISRDRTGAYRYLPQSVNTFIDRQGMMEMMGNSGFGQVKLYPMTLGICVCYTGVRQ